MQSTSLIKPKHTQEWLLVLVLLFVLLIKIYFVMQTPLPAYDSYYGIRQVEHVHTTGLPFIVDTLSYQGRITYDGILFYTLVAGIAVFIPTIILFKYASIVLSLLVLFLVYKITVRLVKHRWIALLTTILAALSPSLFTAHLNTLLPTSFFAVLYLLLILFFFKSNKKKYISWFVITLVVATLISPLIIVFIVGFAFYFLLLKLESLSIRRREFELLLFSSIFVIWFYILLYKPLFLQYGAKIIWKTMPKELVVQTFQGLTLPLAISLIGVLPLLLGMYAIYFALFVKRSKLQLFLTAMAFSFGVITWFGFLPLTEGLFYTTLTFILLSAPTLVKLNLFADKTILPKARAILLLIFFLLVFLNFSPTIIYKNTLAEQAPTLDEASVFTALSKQLPNDAVVLGSIQEGFLITDLMKRKNFYDENFILAPHAQQRYDDAKKIYLSQSQTTILSTLQEYGITHILITPLTLAAYPDATKTFTDNNCFLPVYQWNNITAYKVTCHLKNN